MADIKCKIIGGEFAIPHDLMEQNNTALFDEVGKYYYSSGRCALYHILKDTENNLNKKREVLLPDYLCDSITNTVVDANFNYSFYHIKSDLHIDLECLKLCDLENKILLLIDYFGMTDLSLDIDRIKSSAPNIVIVADCVQAYYSIEKYDADYSFSSFRKWFACPDGAIVLKKDSSKMNSFIRDSGIWWQYKYAGNILKEYQEFVDDNIALRLLEKGEEELDKNYLCQWNSTSKKLFLNLDKKEIQRKRKENARYLHKKLVELNIKHVYSDEGTPLFVPIFIDNRDEFRRAFFEEKIYTPKHWPISTKDKNGVNELYDKELSLICDQRYSIEDMEKQIKVIKNRQGMLM